MSEIKIGYVIKRLLKEQRRTLKEVSRETEIPYSTLHTWYENRQPKDIIKAQRLAEFFGISLHQLLFDQEETHEQKKPEKIEAKKDGVLVGTFEVVIRRID
jgi:transcriptional regulator with XRE-family HTH domain